MIQCIETFVRYFGNIRQRTLNYISAITVDQFEWSARPGEFTCCEIILHLAAAEQIFAGAVSDRRWKYSSRDDLSGGDSGLSSNI